MITFFDKLKEPLNYRVTSVHILSYNIQSLVDKMKWVLVGR